MKPKSLLGCLPYTKALLTAWMNYGDKVRKYPNGRFPGGGNAAYRKSVFDKVDYSTQN